MKRNKLFALVLCLSLFAVLFSSCTKKDDKKDEGNKIETGSYDQLDAPKEGDEIAVIHTNHGDIYVRLFPEEAPKAVENFTTHAKNGYYDGLIFHRVIKDFMIQGGDPTGNGGGGESIWGGKFEDEFAANRLNITGALAMANAGENTNGSQFFINNVPASSLPSKEQMMESYEADIEEGKEYYEENKDNFSEYKNFDEFFKALYLGQGQSELTKVTDEAWELYKNNGGNIHLDGAWRTVGGHTVFGQVFEGMDVVTEISNVATGEGDKPAEDVVIKNIEITTYKK